VLPGLLKWVTTAHRQSLEFYPRQDRFSSGFHDVFYSEKRSEKFSYRRFSVGWLLCTFVLDFTLWVVGKPVRFASDAISKEINSVSGRTRVDYLQSRIKCCHVVYCSYFNRRAENNNTVLMSNNSMMLQSRAPILSFNYFFYFNLIIFVEGHRWT